MPKLRLLADEDIDSRLTRSLSNKGIDIIYADKGIKNSKLYLLACEKQRVLLTRDKDFLNTSLFPPLKLQAIIVVRIHRPKLSELESRLLDFITRFSDDKKGKTFMLTSEGIRIAD